MALNHELEQNKEIDIHGKRIPLTQVTWEMMCDPKAQFPLNYDFRSLPHETQIQARLAPELIENLLGVTK